LFFFATLIENIFKILIFLFQNQILNN
jgi:hypothetical protein